MGQFDDLVPPKKDLGFAGLFDEGGPRVPYMGFMDLVPESQRAKEAAAQTAAQTGAGESFFVGGGRAVNQAGAGLSQAANAAVAGLPLQRLGIDRLAGVKDAAQSRLDALSKSQREQDVMYNALKAEHPYATSFGEELPYAAIPAGAGPMATGLLVGGGEAAKYGSAKERALRGALGFGSGSISSLISRLFGNTVVPGGGQNVPNQTQRDAVTALRDIGGNPRLSQVTGSPVVARMEDWAATTPGGISRMAANEARNKTALTREAARTIGQRADELSTDTFANARTAIGSVFNELRSLGNASIGNRSVRPIAIDQGVERAANLVLQKQAKIAPEFRNADVQSLAQRALTLARNGGRIDAETYQLARSSLTDAAQDAFQANNSQVGQAYRALLDALDAAADTSLRNMGRGDLIPRLGLARQQWANLRTLEKGRAAAGGDANPNAIVQALRTNNPMAFREGRMGPDSLYRVGLIGENLKPLAVGSQTYPRMAFGDLLGSTLKFPFANAAARMTTNPYLGSYASMLINNPQAAALARALVQDASRTAALPAPALALPPWALVPQMTE